MAKVPTQSKYNAVKRQDTDVPSFERKTKTEIIKDAGFTPKQVQRFETLAKHRDIVEQAKAKQNKTGAKNLEKYNASKSNKPTSLCEFTQTSKKEKPKIDVKKELAKRIGTGNSGIAANSINLDVIEIVSKTSRFMRLLGIKSSTLLTVRSN